MNENDEQLQLFVLNITNNKKFVNSKNAVLYVISDGNYLEGYGWAYTREEALHCVHGQKSLKIHCC